MLLDEGKSKNFGEIHKNGVRFITQESKTVHFSE